MLRDASGRLVMTKGWKAFFIIAAIMLLAAIIVLSVFLGLSRANEQKWMANSEYNYENAYYTLTDSLLNMENGLSKLRVSSSDGLVNEMLVDVAMSSQIAVANLTTLSYSGYDLSSAIKYCNQVGDYCKYLAHKIATGGTLSDEERTNLDGLFQSTYKLAVALSAVKESLVAGNMIVEGIGKLNVDFVNVATGLVDGSIEYPALIYDGAFSDSLDDKEAKALSGEDISKDNQQDRIKKILSDYEVSAVEFLAESSNGFDSYIYQVTLSGGNTATVQIAKKGGAIVMWDCSFDSQEPKLSVEEGVELAEQYISKQGYSDMKGVYACVTDGLLYVNMCYVKDDVIYYPDMIKVKVSLDDGKIVGFEGLNYIYSHTDRELDKPTVTEGEVRNMNFGGLNVTSIRLALIPTTGGGEVLTYEVFGNMDNYNFYVFVDAATGQQIKVMQIIDSSEGELLM